MISIDRLWMPHPHDNYTPPDPTPNGAVEQNLEFNHGWNEGDSVYIFMNLLSFSISVSLSVRCVEVMDVHCKHETGMFPSVYNFQYAMGTIVNSFVKSTVVQISHVYIFADYLEIIHNITVLNSMSDIIWFFFLNHCIDKRSQWNEIHQSKTSILAHEIFMNF